MALRRGRPLSALAGEGRARRARAARPRARLPRRSRRCVPRATVSPISQEATGL